MRREDPVTFTRELGYINSWHHKEWYFLAVYSGQQNILILGPRSHAKTECLSVNLPCWLLGRDRNVRVLIVSNTATQASSIIRQIRLRLEANQAYRKLFSSLQEGAQVWSDEALQVRRTRDLKDPSISGVGVLGPIIGRRADWIIADDVVDRENSATQLQRDKVDEWFKQVLLPVLEPNGRMIVVGSTYHYDDLYARLEKSIEWTVRKYKAIQDDGTALWPARWPLEKLEQRRREMGTLLFNSQFQSDPSGLKGLFFKESWLQYYDEVPGGLRVYQGVDPAITDSPESDYFVIATIGVDQQNEIYLLHVFRERLDFPSQVKAIQSQAAKWRPERIGVEAVAYQRALSQQVYALSGLPVTEVKVTTNKLDRMARRTPYFEAKHFHIKREQDDFITEYLQFPRGEHDDILDAVDLALEVSISGVEPSWLLMG